MGHVLKSFDFGDGRVEKETACMNYKCKFCGVEASACNYVLNLCLQVYAPHYPGCGAYVEDETKAAYNTSCETCEYYIEGSCTSDDSKS